MKPLSFIIITYNRPDDMLALARNIAGLEQAAALLEEVAAGEVVEIRMGHCFKLHGTTLQQMRSKLRVAGHQIRRSQ